MFACYHRVRVREKDKGQSYALSMSYHNTTKHYKIDKRKTATGEVFAIEEGPTFENLMDVSTLLILDIIFSLEKVNCLKLRFRIVWRNSHA